MSLVFRLAMAGLALGAAVLAGCAGRNQEAPEKAMFDRLRADFPLRAGLSVDDVNRITGQGADGRYRYMAIEKCLAGGTGYIRWLVAGEFQFWCDVGVVNGRVENVWVVPGNMTVVGPGWIRLSGTGPRRGPELR